MNIERWKYCPFCGEREITIVKNYVSCVACKRGVYENVSTTCSIALFTPEGEVVLCERARDPYKGKYDLPGGYVDSDESGVDAIIREVREELDFNLDESRINLLTTAPERYPIDQDLYTQFLDLSFAYPITQKEFRAMKALDDVAAIRLVALSDMKNIDLAWKHDEITLNIVREKL